MEPEKEKVIFNRLDKMCARVEYGEGWSSHTIRGRSSKKEVVGYRNQIISDALDQGIPHKALASYFGKTIQSIYAAPKRAQEDREYRERRAKIEGDLCDV